MLQENPTKKVEHTVTANRRKFNQTLFWEKRGAFLPGDATAVTRFSSFMMLTRKDREKG